MNFLQEFFRAKAPKRPFSVVMIEFMALALGPKRCDLDIPDLKQEKRSLGRVQFDVNI